MVQIAKGILRKDLPRGQMIIKYVFRLLHHSIIIIF